MTGLVAVQATSFGTDLGELPYKLIAMAVEQCHAW